MAGMWIVTFVTVSFIASHRYGGVLKSDSGHTKIKVGKLELFRGKQIKLPKSKS